MTISAYTPGGGGAGGGGGGSSSATKIAIIGDSHTRGVMGQEPVFFPLGARPLPSLASGFNTTGLIVQGYSEASIPASTACNIRFDGTNMYCTLGTDTESAGVPIVSGSKKGGFMTLTGGAGTHVGKKIVLYVRQRFVATTSSGSISITLGSGVPQSPHVNNQAYDSWLSFFFAKNGLHSYHVTNYAVSGNSTYDMLNGDTADMIALAPKYLFVMGGYNDNSEESLYTIGTPTAQGSPADNIISIVTQALSAGITPIVASPIFVVNQVTSSARGYYGQLQIYAKLRKAFRNDPRVFFVEPSQALLNHNNYTVIAGSGNATSQPTMAGIAKYFKPDTVHPNMFGAWTMYNYMSSLLTDTGIPPRRAIPSHLGDRTISSVSDPTAISAYGGVPKTNILGLMSIFATPFKHFAGSGGGSLTAGAVPGDWSLTVSGTVPTILNLYPSDHASAGEHPETFQRCMRYEVTAGIGTGTMTLIPILSTYIPADIGGASVMSGKRARAFFQYRMTDMTLFDNMTVRITFTGATSLDVYLVSFDTNTRLLTGDTITDTGVMTIVSPEFTIPASITGINPRIAFAVNATGTVNMDVYRFDVELID